ncbi:spore coat protein B [Bacillus albus]|nr:MULTISPECIES: spore coat protein B [Bacillus]MBU5219787.1 spore coat protein B [Bacillus albus]MDA2029500.1 spore coat protein B [Bacillus cereus group sp. Bcc03]MDA2219406.1 spore coat protein B [Bacillus cereus group sp. Bc228]MDA2230647.1 spore coat protein B [Bacillus cereus group sp. Bc227]MDA2263752.1 spore coat protein B [Bacillus cereus group sp. Bc200]
MKKAIIVIASTAITLYTIKNRKKKHNKNDLYYPYTLLKKK